MTACPSERAFRSLPSEAKGGQNKKGEKRKEIEKKREKGEKVEGPGGILLLRGQVTATGGQL